MQPQARQNAPAPHNHHTLDLLAVPSASPTSSRDWGESTVNARARVRNCSASTSEGTTTAAGLNIMTPSPQVQTHETEAHDATRADEDTCK